MVMVFNATFNNISVIYHGGQFYWWRKLEKTTDLLLVTDKLYHMNFSINKVSQILYMYIQGAAVVIWWLDL
jgi:hypothetical protein